ncbi:MAG: NAD(P)/FAD-dependent oxidoreductase [Gemmatimonadota bacterium]|nr:MAG: NAD(P)/FAD-dependent oxidoreductase [Gemmatimonadota bacterium]
MNSRPIEIVGSGPAGLAAALTVAHAGGRAVVSERSGDVGHRFHNDFQGLENWTTRGDVLEELAQMGIEPTFEATPFRECVVFDPDGRDYTYRSQEPIWYLVRRGSEAGTVDYALKEQAQAAGVELRMRHTVERLPQGGIVAHGPRRTDVIAVGYVGETDRADGAYAALSDDLAPKGYSYLLICGGRVTVASCLFSDFHNEAQYLDRTVEFFRDRVGLELTNARRFGGFGNVHSTSTARKGNLLYVGEAAGFQDALFGFGMRSALLSGHFAARAWLEGEPQRYEDLWRPRLEGILRAGFTNRFLFERLGNGGYVRLLRRIKRTGDAREFLRKWYGPGIFRRALYPLMLRRSAGKRDLLPQCREGCDCTYCRCVGHGGTDRNEPVPAPPGD